MSNVLVTGGAGFVGSHTVDLLVEEGYNVVVLDNFEFQVHRGKKPSHLNKKAKYIRGDVRFGKHWLKALADCEYIVHLAAAVGVSQSFWQSRKYMSVNTLGTASLYDILLRRKDITKRIEKIVIASSKSIYGEGTYLCRTHGVVFPHQRRIEQLELRNWEESCPVCSEPVIPAGTPETKPVQNLSPYALAKYDTERIAMNYAEVLELPTVAFRYFNIYGTRQSLNNPYTGVLAIIISRLKNSKRPILFEDGKQMRDFVNVQDVALYNQLALGKGQGVYNLGTGVPTSLLEMTHKITSLMNLQIEPEITHEFRPGDNRHDFADISRLKLEFGEHTFMKDSDGLEELVNWSQETTALDLLATAELERKKYISSVK